ncbi:unnamed protein product [Vicia faba]|uniref:Pentatricopeptide repeat-containing protein n=1 Tax=Vicia faba TaxID=3906 RepID=A0AAV1AMZ3_VICFA|nr:unnamed protein product [Vicia faba]
MTTNLIESMNGVFKGIRNLPVTVLVKPTYFRMASLFAKRDPSSIFNLLKFYALSPTNIFKVKDHFHQIHKPTLSHCNLMIRGWSQTDNPIEAIHTYNLMYRQGLIGSNLTYPFLLKTCARISHVFCTRMVHARVLKLGFESVLIVSNTLIHVYAGFGELGFVCRVFDETSERDLVSWNYLIYGYGRCKRYREVLGVFEAMRMANVVTMVKVVLACSVLGE